MEDNQETPLASFQKGVRSRFNALSRKEQDMLRKYSDSPYARVIKKVLGPELLSGLPRLRKMPTQQLQEGGNVQGDMENLGLINEQTAVPPQNGGEQSVQDDIPREADEGDYILPYETVLMVGLKQLNRYAKEAIKLAMENNVSLQGTDIDPTDDVPIRVSNYEFHIPKMLVPFFGGGKKYLDKIRNEGLALRKRLEEEKQPPVEEQQPMPQQATPAPAPSPQMVEDAAPQQPPPLMRKGGFVLKPQEDTAATMLEGDTSQATPQERQKRAQQPRMIDPVTGKSVQEGFSAPQGYQDGKLVKLTPFQEAFKAARDRGDPIFEFGGEKYSTKQAHETKAYKTVQNMDPKTLMAFIAYAEARGEPSEGQQAIMHVIRNRVNKDSKEFGGSDYRNVMLKKHAFSALTVQDPKQRKNFNTAFKSFQTDPMARKLEAYADGILRGDYTDFTKGATFYYNPKAVAKTPKFAMDRVPLYRIGNHVFLNEGGFVNGHSR